jgi:long-chain acyl-CoA synthetase
MPPDLLDRALAAWPHAEFFQAYGLTETAGAVVHQPARQPHRAGRAQRPALVGRPGRAGRRDPRRRRAGPRRARGTVGEIIVRGPMVTRGYWGQPDTSARALRDGWFHTGDGGRMDADGYLTSPTG